MGFKFCFSPRKKMVWVLPLLAIFTLCTGCGHREHPTTSGPNLHNTSAWFVDRATEAGIDFRLGHAGKSPLTLLETIGTGCAIFDYDNDGNADLFFVGQPMAGKPGVCRLYHNHGDGTFQDVTQGSGLETPGFYTGCAVADIDNDGLPDLLVTGYGVVRLYRNLGGGKFADITRGSGLEAPSPTSWATSAAFGDFDRDGKIDLYIGRYVAFDAHSVQFCNDRGTIRTACGPKMYDAQRGSLYRNLGNGHFQDVTRAVGLDKAHGKCLGVLFSDLDGDGWPDLYLGNDEMPGDLFLNRPANLIKSGHSLGRTSQRAFQEEATLRGVALAEDSKPQGAMGVDRGDFDRNGKLSLIVAAFQFEGTSLYTDAGDGTFVNRSTVSGLGGSTRNNVGFGIKIADFDNDGWLDIAQANGHVYDNEEQVDKMSHYRQPIQLFMNSGRDLVRPTSPSTTGQLQNLRFIEHTQEAGPGFTTPCVGRALAVGDLDNDGKLDLVVTDLEGRARILFNRMPGTGNWLRIRLEGSRSNRMGIGAQVRVFAGEQHWEAEANTGGSYFAASDGRLHIGLGSVTKVDRITVKWPSGKQSIVKNPKVPGDLTIREN